MTNKYILILFLIVVFLIDTNKHEQTQMAFNNNQYTLEFKECDLNTNNFIDKLSTINIEYDTIQIIPYYNIKYYNSFNYNEFIYSTNNLEDILSSFKDKYLSILVDNDGYVTNICIKTIVINKMDYKTIEVVR